MNTKLSINDLIAMAEQSSISYVVSTGASKCSVSIVNSINGKRLSFSKALCKDVGLTDRVYLLPVAEQGKLLIANNAISSKASNGSLSGQEKKICYSAILVNMITNAFKLDFSNKTSMAFTDIEYDTVNGIKVAIVNIVTPSGEDTTDEDSITDNS